MHLYGDMWARQHRAISKASEAVTAAADAALTAAKQSASQAVWSQAPSYIKESVGPLLPHQLDGVKWLQQQWVKGSHAILADDTGMGKAATVVAHLLALQ
jgi:SNF2 family DNA or RNA helicase